ncbi:methyltransferase domain-containing protein [Pseudomonas fluorescens]|uniref:methyltransferase domain-containing protein n=1 Tax=Pseudomonas TaxID=286 RepID=UPI000C887A03|nr:MULTISPECIES: methyltransferase domain-containing protein [Pseudomonas]MBD8256542.1 methyltransferase domain-containing protein [Pseudomonas fluorescens]PMZ72441.1 class I SAM-dependent methyltransferase [Pseudomonas sp. GW247-3R2A]MBH3400091.1 methyltransferase domain-containing protein [Pseudomonas fluorescens]MBJ2321089.1 methyltransferase domain-containing protein [Pseudomonas fluorescens]MDV3054422.1 methyltransferase domain-containing protein [Pseudomonas paracarnis]
MNNKSYVLNVGQDDLERLGKSDRIYGPGSRDFLQRYAHIKEGMTVLDVGCGTGNMSLWMAEKVGPGGQVIGIDASAEQIAVCKARAEALGYTNTRFEQLDFSQIHSLNTLFDIAYCRFILIHLTQPLEAIKLMSSVTRPGGAVVCEEPVTDLHECSPEHTAFDHANKLTIALGRAKGVDYNLGARLAQLFAAAELDDLQFDHYQPSISDENDRGIFFDSFTQIADNLLEHALATPEQIHSVGEQLSRLKDDHRYSIKGFRNIQGIGRRRPVAQEDMR